jgi:hypothetical protein
MLIRILRVLLGLVSVLLALGMIILAVGLGCSAMGLRCGFVMFRRFVVRVFHIVSSCWPRKLGGLQGDLDRG